MFLTSSMTPWCLADFVVIIYLHIHTHIYNICIYVLYIYINIYMTVLQSKVIVRCKCLFKAMHTTAPRQWLWPWQGCPSHTHESVRGDKGKGMDIIYIYIYIYIYGSVNWVITGSDKGLSPVWFQNITGLNDEFLSINRTTWNTFQKWINKHKQNSFLFIHYDDVIMGAIASQITSLTITYWTVYRRRSKKTSKLRVTGLCAGNSPGTGEFPAHMASNAENVSIWWRHHVPL